VIQCTSKSGEIVLDSNWSCVHDNCYDENECSSDPLRYPGASSKNCYLDGADYIGTYGIPSNESPLKLVFVTEGSSSTNIVSRAYL
jgi:cellulose 1,4-beta-cellobiosidase